jgi:predicted transcriptional regulator
MQELCNLLFELSNIDRLNILIELKKKPMKLSHVSKRFGFTVPETARNISRLHEANLVFKDVSGVFHLTPVGEEALHLLPGFKFLSKQKRYFMTHSLNALPSEFVTGIGALVNCKFVGEITESFFIFENMIREADEYVWILVDQVLASALPLISEAVKRGVEIRKILPRNANIPEGILALANDPVFDRAARAHKLESRYLNKVDVCIFVSDKAAAISFPDLEGRFDYLDFIATDYVAQEWLSSLYSYYWDRAKR